MEAISKRSFHNDLFLPDLIIPMYESSQQIRYFSRYTRRLYKRADAIFDSTEMRNLMESEGVDIPPESLRIP
jgi:hypothetical protein